MTDIIIWFMGLIGLISPILLLAFRPSPPPLSILQHHFYLKIIPRNRLFQQFFVYLHYIIILNAKIKKHH